SRRRHTRSKRDWSSDVCSSDLTPKHSVMNKETVGVLLSRLSDRGLAEIDRCCQPGDVTGVADLQAIHRLGRVSDFLGDTEIVIRSEERRVGKECRFREGRVLGK